MAMSEQFGENIDKLTCTLCLELYKSPKVLPCLHSFCEQCLEKFISSLGANKEGSVSPFGCPICRTKVNPIKKYTEVKEWVSDFPSNAMITLMLVQNEGRKIECDPCKRADETSDAKVWCPSCMESLCEMCEKMHKRIKASKDHRSIELSEIGERGHISELDFSAISEFCPYHPRKELDYFCSNHDMICCSTCVLSNHKNCETILIEDTTETTTMADLSSLPSELTIVKDEASKLLEDRKQQKAKLKSYAEKVNDDAFTFTENIKSRLDNLLEVFNKEVSILQEEENTDLNVAIRLIEQLLSALEHWTNVLEKVPENASETKRFQIGETIKKQISECLSELSLQTNKPDIDELKFDTGAIDGIVKGLESLDRVVNLVVTKSCAVDKLSQVKAIFERTKMVSSRILSLSFETLSLKFIRKIKVQEMHDIICGTCLGQKYILVGGRKELDIKVIMVLCKDTGATLSEVTVDQLMKSVCFDEKNNRIFLACHNQTLFTLELNETQCKIISCNKTERILGGICCRGEQVFLVNEGSVLSFPSSTNPETTHHKQCFSANTSSLSLGLTIHSESLYYNTTNNQVKCTTLNGTHIFSFKSRSVAKPRKLAVLQSGLVLVVDFKKKKLDLISADGKKSRILLENFEHVKSPEDLWLDSDGTTFYVCSGENIDVYQIQ